MAMLVLTSAVAAAQSPAAPAPTGDAKHGRQLFESSLRCYACHGFDGQTGSPRLVPMGRAQEAFVAYVRKPSGRGMPSFAATPDPDQAEV
jgi:mono/diheme cytochrome c family protein